MVNPLPSSHRAQAHPYDLRSASGRAGWGEVMRLCRMLAPGRASRLFGRVAPLASSPRARVSALRLAVRRPGAGRRRGVGAAGEGGLDEADGMAPDRMRGGAWPRGARASVPSLVRRAVQAGSLDETVRPETCEVEKACRGPFVAGGGGPGWARGGAGAGGCRPRRGVGRRGAASPLCPVLAGRFRCVL